MSHPVLDIVIGLYLALVIFYGMVWTAARKGRK